MKTAISIPDPIFQSAESFAHQMGISRSELFTKAVAEYLEKRKQQYITDALNKIYAKPEKIDNTLQTMQIQSLPKEEW